MEKTCNFCGITGSSEASIHDLNPDNYMDCRAKEIMIEKGCCFDCAFFFELIEKQKNNSNWIVIDGESWIFGLIAPKGQYFKGCGGRLQYAKKFDGTLLMSNNVWHQGSVPECFKKLIPNTREFITKEQYENEKSN